MDSVVPSPSVPQPYYNILCSFLGELIKLWTYNKKVCVWCLEVLSHHVTERIWQRGDWEEGRKTPLHISIRWTQYDDLWQGLTSLEIGFFSVFSYYPFLLQFSCWPVIYFSLMLMLTGCLAPLAPMVTLIFTLKCSSGNFFFWARVSVNNDRLIDR